MLAKVTVRVRDVESGHLLAPGRMLVLGRSADCDLCVAETSVSRRHASIAVLDDALHVADLGSSHGLRWRGRKAADARLAVGDAVSLGDAELRLVGWEAPAAVALHPEVAAALATRGVAPWPPDGAATTPPAPAPAAPAAKAPPTAAEPAASSPSADAPGELAVGTLLAGYRILGRLGAGGYAIVYRAEQVQLGREVALKVLRAADEAAAPDAVTAFLREARAAAALADARLVQVFDLGEADGRRFLSMELLRGGSLADAMRRDGPVPWRALLPILRDVAGALQVAHKAGLVHRDVKPANILLTEQRRAKLADLGLIRAAGGAGDRVGTAAYMAPEQLTDAPVDGRADVYALGCTAYHALTGAPPFQGTVKEIVRQKRAADPEALPPKLGVPAMLERLILERMLARDPAARLPDAAAVLDELDRVERTGGAPARRAAAVRARAGERRGGGGGAGPWIGLLLALGVFALAYVLWRTRVAA
jgi:serine/threonine-protein kinase